MTRRGLLILTSLVLAAGLAAVFVPALLAPPDPLPSWNEGPAKTEIMAFVKRVTTEDGADFVPAAQRIATFDNDGTLWVEQPDYVQAVFTLDRVKALAPQHPEWAEDPLFKAALAGDAKAVAAQGTNGFETLIAVTHAGMTAEEFKAIVEDWLATARHPRFGRPYTELVYQPMRELLTYLRANGFKTYIVSGGGIEFMRPWVGKAYGFLPEQVIGSSIKLAYELNGDTPVLRHLPEVDFIDDGPGKAIGIATFIGRRPVFAAGNSDGDLEMLQWTTMAEGPRFGMIVHHTDAEREWAYDRESPIGRLDKALDQAPQRGWVVVDMKRDWKVIFPFETR